MAEGMDPNVGRGASGAKTHDEGIASAAPAPKEDAQRRAETTQQQTERQEETGMEDHWVKLAQELWDVDKDLVENVNGSIDSLLTFAGLLSAVQSAFAIATYPLLQPASGVTSPLSQPPQPKASVVVMNVFVFSSLALALICASVGILRKTQLKQHLAWTKKRTDARAQIVARQLSYELNSCRMLWDSASHFSWGLTLSIGLFAVGIFIFLWTMNHSVAWAVLVFACFTLCVIFSRDILKYYHLCRDWICVKWYWLRCQDWVFVIEVVVNLICSWNSHMFIRETVPRPSVGDHAHFHLLSRAIMSRTLELTASGVDPYIGRLARSIVGLGKLPHGTGQKVVASEASKKNVGLERAVDTVLAILQDRDPLKGSISIPVSLWSRVKGHFTLTQPAPRQRQALSYMSDLAFMTLPWMFWITHAFRELNIEEKYLLATVISDQFPSYLRMTEPLQPVVSGMQPALEDSLYSAFLLAYCMRQQFIEGKIPLGPLDLKLRQFITLAAVRLQFSNLPKGARLTSARNLDHSGHENPAASFVEWANKDLQRTINKRIAEYSYTVYWWFFDERDDLAEPFDEESAVDAFLQAAFDKSKYSSERLDEEFAVDTFLQAALGATVMPLHPELSPGSWMESSPGLLFRAASTHALLILKIWHSQSAASVESRRPEIIRLGFQLAKLLRYDLPVSPSLDHLATSNFPGYGALEHCVDDFPAETGALLRLTVREAFHKSWVVKLWLDILAALFPPNSKADDHLQATISQHRAKHNQSAHSPGSDCITSPGTASACAVGADQEMVATMANSPHHREVPELSVELEINKPADVRASDPGHNHLAAHVTSPHRTIDIIPAEAAPDTAAGADATAPTLLSDIVRDQAGENHASQETSVIDVDDRNLHLLIDMQPVPRF